MIERSEAFRPGSPPAACVPPLPPVAGFADPRTAKPCMSDQIASVAAAGPDRTADRAAGATRSAGADDDPVREAIATATDVGRSAAARAGFPSAIERFAAGAASVPTACSCTRLHSFSAPAPHTHSEDLAGCNSELGSRLRTCTRCARSPCSAAGCSDDVDPNPTNVGRNDVVLRRPRELELGVHARALVGKQPRGHGGGDRRDREIGQRRHTRPVSAQLV